MTRIAESIVLILGLSSVALAAEPRPELTKAPLTYILDYGREHVGSPAYVEMIAKAPPTLLHLGKDVPFTHSWGPIQALGGENQAYGKRRPYADEDFIRRLSPDETQQRVADLTKLVADLHRAGVKWVTPYICSMTMGGHPERRAGFWEFYDHWNEYRAFGLRPRPLIDPIQWMQRGPDGAVVFFYKFEGAFYPSYEPNIRYAACQNNPLWRHWTEKVVENVARCGFDGVFVDNAGSLRCHCSFCKEKWRSWIDARYSPAQRQELFGTEQPELSDGKEPGLLWAETSRFRCASLAEHLAAIRAAGQRITGRPFVVFPNGGEKRPEHVLHIYPDADLIMFERSVGPNGTHPGMVLRPIAEDVCVKKYNDNVFEYKFVQCLRRKVRPIMLTRPGWQVPTAERLLLEMNPGGAALGNAEAAAFGGGGAFLQRADPALMQVQKQYRQFFEQHAALYEGLDSWAEVGVAVFPDLGWLGNKVHQLAVRTATRHLTDGHVLFDYLIDDQFTATALRKYTAVVLPSVSHLSPQHAAALVQYVREGGTAIVMGASAEFDQLGRKQEMSRLAEILAAPADRASLAVKRVGKGAAGYVQQIPSEGTALVEWLEKLSGRTLAVLAGDNTSERAKVRINAFRRPGTQQFVVHLVNYNVPLGVKAREPEPQGPLDVVLRLPEAGRLWKVRAYDPQGQTIELPAKVDGKTVRFTLPELRIYRGGHIGG